MKVVQSYLNFGLLLCLWGKIEKYRAVLRLGGGPGCQVKKDAIIKSKVKIAKVENNGYITLLQW